MPFNQVYSLLFKFTGSLLLGVGAYLAFKKYFHRKERVVEKAKKTPISVNYHFSRKCNYSCGFCFHTAKNSHILTLQDAKTGLRKLKDAGK